MNYIRINQEWKQYAKANRMSLLYHLPVELLDYFLAMTITSVQDNRLRAKAGKLVKEYRIETNGLGKEVAFVLFRIYQTNGEFTITQWLPNAHYDLEEGVHSHTYLDVFDLDITTTEEEIRHVIESFFLYFEWDKQLNF